jgi:hypothetical protein
VKNLIPAGNLAVSLAVCLLDILSNHAHAAEPSQSAKIPEDFPRFVVPGQEKEMESLRHLFWMYYQPSGPLIALWDAWMPMSTLWPARGSGPALLTMRARWAMALAYRLIDAEGYVATQQHDGPAHAEGWPFPSWIKAGGVGWHFRGTGVEGYDPLLSRPDGWLVTGGNSGEVNEKGWVLNLIESRATAQSPAFEMPACNGPWLRLNWWAEDLTQANCYVEWTTKDQPEFGLDRRFYFAPATADGETHYWLAKGGGGGHTMLTRDETRTMIPVYRSPTWKGTITGLRIGFANSQQARVVIKSFHTACDTRHTINNLNFIRAVHDYFNWSLDLTFLRSQIARARIALRFTMREGDTRKRNCVYTTWPGHEGRSGVRWTADGQKQIIPGQGIGGNYWDLLPFGGQDALATINYYDTLLRLAELEEAIAAHPKWNITSADAFDPTALRRHAQAVKDYGTKQFWNPLTGRFGTVDLDSVLHDYGWTFLNNDAVDYGFATLEQARRIRDWISGRRIVEGDTSIGADIYYWRMAPRTSTRRNLDYYYWGWSKPETYPWGHGVEDGGAVVGFAYQDLMSRLRVDGPDDAWKRLREILVWFEETQAAGGYRAYYDRARNRGTLQGGNDPGGLGLDMEFFEGILLPQVMLYGFMGFEPTPGGFRLNPRLPNSWPELRITRVHLHDFVLELTAKADGRILIRTDCGSEAPMEIQLAPGLWRTQAPGAHVNANHVTIRLPAGALELSPVR